MSTEDIFPVDGDKSFPLDLEIVPLSEKLKQRGMVQSISIDKRKNTIKVTLNHRSNTSIISSIYPIWDKTLKNFEKQAAYRKSLSKDDINDIQTVLDSHYEVITNHLFNNPNASASFINYSVSDKEKEQIRNTINKLRSDHNKITLDECRNTLLIKYLYLQSVIEKDMQTLWSGLEFELSIQKILNIKDCTLPFAGIILGVSSSLKTQCIELLRSWPNTFYTDNFSAKSFVFHTTAMPKEMLAEIDLLPKIKNKCFLTPELAPTFAAKDDDLIQILGIMTTILDGNWWH